MYHLGNFPPKLVILTFYELGKINPQYSFSKKRWYILRIAPNLDKTLKIRNTKSGYVQSFVVCPKRVVSTTVVCL